MTHVRNKVKELVPIWNKNGYQGVSLSAYIQGTEEPEPGEQTVKQKLEIDKNYCDFIVEANFDVFSFEEKPFVSITVDEEGFWEQFKQHLQVEFGSDVVIVHRPKCNEFEIQRVSK